MSSTLTPKALFKNYIKKEGWKGLTVRDYSFLFTMFILVIILLSMILNYYYDIGIYSAFISFFDTFYITGFIAAISILMLIVTGFAIIGSIMEKEFLFAAQVTGIMKIIYFVVFWDALWAGISSFFWVTYGFFDFFDINILSLIFGIIGLLTIIYVICITISLIITITRLFELKGDYVKNLLKMNDKKSSD